MAKKEVKATYLQLKGAFKKHGKVANGGDLPSHHLLRFYANECGLKAIFLRDENLNDTGDLIGKLGKKYGHGHDLLAWIREVKIPAFAISFDDNENDPLANVHEKLRYGVGAHENQLAFLRSLHSLLKKHL